MLQEDYIMRMINEVVRTLLKLLFNIDTKSPSADLLEGTEKGEILNELLKLVELGEINDAENRLYEMTSSSEQENLELALLFYSYLNKKSDDFLEEYDFSRDEVKQGLQDLIARYGLKDMVELFLSDL